MTSLLTALNNFPFTSTTRRAASDVSELEFQSIFAATAVLLAGGIAATLVALVQAS